MKLLLFGADWCPPCRHMKEITKELEVTYYNIDYQGRIADDYEVKKIPTIIKVDIEGKEISRFFGIINSKEELIEALK